MSAAQKLLLASTGLVRAVNTSNVEERKTLKKDFAHFQRLSAAIQSEALNKGGGIDEVVFSLLSSAEDKIAAVSAIEDMQDEGESSEDKGSAWADDIDSEGLSSQIAGKTRRECFGGI